MQCFLISVFHFRCKSSHTEIHQFKAQIKESNNVKIVNRAVNGADSLTRLHEALDTIIATELGMDDSKLSVDDNDDDGCDPASLCDVTHWDLHGNSEQLEKLNAATRCLCTLGFEKHYDRLNAHISAAGPLPPLLVTGASGSGKSLLLAKWVRQLQERLPTSLILYHFVGCSGSSTADPINMLARLTRQ
ncbi:PREDICTED: nephrocystin-3-like, partial [Priapulus caudatus]|uniref:Nephrocystin-3-like n=1 Tax=Priapulus caudatus TaxID=37621 RepID=A0ABM1F4R1_PRICU